MLRTILINDVPLSREVILHRIQSHHSEKVHIIAQADSVRDGINAIRTHLPDLILLDIELTDGDRFTILDNIGDSKFAVICISGYSDYAARSYQYRNIVHFLHKSFTNDEFHEAIKRAEYYTQKKATPFAFNKIVIPTSIGKMLFPPEEILYASAADNYTNISILNRKSPLLTPKTLKEFEANQLTPERGFARIHRSHIINLHHAVRVEREGKILLVLMSNSVSIPVSNSFQSQLLELLAY
jgi:two-component system LytT family response regulator